MGGAQTLSVTMNEGVVIGIDVDGSQDGSGLRLRYCDLLVESLDEAISLAEEAKRAGKALSIGLIGNAAKFFLR